MGCASVAHADSVSDYLSLEGAIGGSDYARGPDGLWIQQGFEHKVNLTAPAVEGGLTGNIIQRQYWGIDWHADFAWLGTIHSQSMATPSDANYNTTTKGCNGPCWPLANYIGSGHDMGVMFTLEPHADYGGWRLSVEAGPYIHRATWSENVIGWVSSPTSAPTSFRVAYKPEWVLGYVVGTSIGYRNFSIAYQFFGNKINGTASNPYNPIWSGTHVLLAKYRANLF
jgi:hypothetical protein